MKWKFFIWSNCNFSKIVNDFFKRENFTFRTLDDIKDTIVRSDLKYLIRLAMDIRSKTPLILAADYIRSYIIYEFGGIYFDIDVSLTRNIDWFFDSIDLFLVIADRTWMGNIWISFLGAKPKHPIMANIVKMSKTVIKTLRLFEK